MNPVFILFVICGGILVWGLISVIFIPLGRFIIRRIKHLCKILDYDDNDNNRSN